MHTIKNLVNSPYDIRLADGKAARLPARGTLENIDIDPLHLPLYRTLGYYEITETDPLDHDENGKKGGSEAPEPTDDLARLRTEYAELVGKRPFHGWKADELQKRIDAALEA